jgi:hypothetical protein
MVLEFQGLPEIGVVVAFAYDGVEDHHFAFELALAAAEIRDKVVG